MKKNKALEMVRTMINGANEYEKKTGDKNPPVYFSKDNLLIIETALQRLESIDNANPSEALIEVDKILGYFGGDDVQIETMTLSKCNVLKIKQALLKAQEQEKATKQFKDSKEVKIEIPESSLMDYNPVKQYLKWEDLEFKGNNEYSYFKVKLGDNIYKAFSYFSYVFNKDTVVIKTNNQFAITEDNKHFFNDLHLERVEE